VQRTRVGFIAGVRRTASRPGTLIAAFTTGMLVTAVLAGPTRRPRSALSSRPPRSRVAAVRGAFRLARTALRAWSRSTVAREMLSPVLEALITGRRHG